MATTADCIKKALNCALAVPGLLGLRPYQVFAVHVTWSGERPGIGTKTITETELLIGGQKPICKQVSASDIFLSNGLLIDKDLKLKLIDEYQTDDMTSPGGIANSLINPPEDPNGYSLQLYFKVIGGEHPTTGQYYKRIRSEDDCNLTKTIWLRATAEKP